jgi:hypothetical protein
MKKTLGGSLAVLAMMLTSAAFADPDNRLTTKDYVDDGLRYLYQRYEPVKTDVSSLKTTVGDSTGGLVKRVTDLENNSSAGAVTQLEQLVGTRGDGTQQNPSTGLVADVEDLETIVGTQGDGTAQNPSTGLVADVEDLKDTVGDSTSGLVKDVEDLKGVAKEYVGGTGITITDGTGANAGKKVISADVVTTWDASVLTTP